MARTAKRITSTEYLDQSQLFKKNTNGDYRATCTLAGCFRLVRWWFFLLGFLSCRDSVCVTGNLPRMS